MDIPKLGQLRQLPLGDDEPNAEQTTGMQISTSRSAGFMVMGLIATASFLVAGFCGIRWGLIDVASTTETHIAKMREDYAGLTAAQLIREYEDMEKMGIELATPYGYKRDQLKKSKWGQNASIAAGVGLLAVLGAVAVAASGRPNRG